MGSHLFLNIYDLYFISFINNVYISQIFQPMNHIQSSSSITITGMHQIQGLAYIDSDQLCYIYLPSYFSPEDLFLKAYTKFHKYYYSSFVPKTFTKTGKVVMNLGGRLVSLGLGI